MTTVRLNWDGGRVTFEVSGHTGYAEAGKDIVCAAVSTLAFTMRRAFLNAVADSMADRFSEDAGDGMMKISMAVFRDKSVIKAEIGAIFEGFKILVQSYPEFVKIAD